MCLLWTHLLQRTLGSLLVGWQIRLLLWYLFVFVSGVSEGLPRKIFVDRAAAWTPGLGEKSLGSCNLGFLRVQGLRGLGLGVF